MTDYQDNIVLFKHQDSGCLLWAPVSFLLLTQNDIKVLYNGCGPQGFLGKVIPESILGLNISFLCCIHDHMYERCCCEEDEDIADSIFAANMTNWVVHHSKWYSKLPRLILAAKYQNAVASTVFSKAYWELNIAECPTGKRYALPKMLF